MVFLFAILIIVFGFLVDNAFCLGHVTGGIVWSIVSAICMTLFVITFVAESKIEYPKDYKVAVHEKIYIENDKDLDFFIEKENNYILTNIEKPYIIEYIKYASPWWALEENKRTYEILEIGE